MTRTETNTKRFLAATGQALFSLLFNFMGLFAGGLVASSLGLFDRIPWALVIYPGILSIRGAIGGLYSGRLSTALHLGTIKPRLFGNTEEAYVLFNTVNTLTLVSALLMGSFGSLVGVVVTGTPLREFPVIMSVIVASMGLSILVISPLTFWVSVISYRRGLDPDVLVYPVVSTLADLIITGLYIGVLSLVAYVPGRSLLILNLVNLVFVATILFSVRKIYRNREFVTTVKEFMMTLVIVTIIVNITGTALNRITEVIGRRPEVFMIYPALIDTVGDVGSIIGSTATTKMALGVMATEVRAILSHWVEIGSAWAASLIMFMLYALTSGAVYGIWRFPDLLAEALTTNLLIVPIIVVISFATAVITRRRGLDPDNFIIPIETSISDGMTTIGLLVAITIILR
jgi:mgtE-like transporter